MRKLIKTRRDLSVWIMSSYWLVLNLTFLLILGNTGIIFGNIIGLGTISAFVFWSKSNKKVNDWLDSEL